MNLSLAKNKKKERRKIHMQNSILNIKVIGYISNYNGAEPLFDISSHPTVVDEMKKKLISIYGEEQEELINDVDDIVINSIKLRNSAFALINGVLKFCVEFKIDTKLMNNVFRITPINPENIKPTVITVEGGDKMCAA